MQFQQATGGGWWKVVVWLISCWVAAQPAHAAAKWLRLEAEGFTILSDASAKDVEKFALDYAAFRETVQELFAPPGRRAPRPLIILFRQEKVFEKHVPKSTKENWRLIVYTTEIDGDAILALPLSGDRRQALKTAFEFDTMWTLRRYGYFLPTWMSQGTGEVLSTHYVRNGKRIFGAPDDRFSGVWMSRSLIPWDKFFGIGLGSQEYDGSKATGQFHAQAWALMRWVLLQDENGRDRFRQLATELRRQSPEAALAAVMGLKDLGREAERSMRGSYALRQLPFDAEAVQGNWKIAPASAAEVQVRLADLLASSGQSAAADWEILQALAAAPHLPEVQEAAARRELRNNRPDLAVDCYRAAIAAGSTNPTAYLRSARDRLDRSRRGLQDILGKGVPSEVQAALAEIRQAIELDPGSGEAYALLGRAFFVAPKLPDDAVEELSEGTGPGEAGARVRLYRGLLYNRLEQMDQAKEDFAAVVAEGDANDHLREEAQRQLDFVEFELARRDIERSLRALAFEAAHARLAEAESLVREPQVRAQLVELAQWLERNEKRLRAQQAANPPAATEAPND